MSFEFRIGLTTNSAIDHLGKIQRIDCISKKYKESIGFIIFIIDNDNYKSITVYHIEVDPIFRRSGIGTLLFGKAVSEADALNRDIINVWNPVAKEFWKAQGFIVGRSKNISMRAISNRDSVTKLM